jgi:hypothetical protein
MYRAAYFMVQKHHYLRNGCCKLARLAGFEPATDGLEVRCSVQLSYRRLAGFPVFNFALASLKEFIL